MPQLTKNDSIIYEWNKFTALLSVDTINFADLQSYIDTISPLDKKDSLPPQGSYLKKK